MDPTIVDSSEQSAINEAILKIQRLDQCQRTINLGWYSPLLKDPLTKRPNYELIFENIYTAFREVSARTKEPLKGNIIKELKEIQKKIDSQKIYRGKNVNKTEWYLLRDQLRELEMNVRFAIKESGYESFDKTSGGGEFD